MKFAVFTNVDHCLIDSSKFAYAPYVDEMNIWFKNVETVAVVGCVSQRKLDNIDKAYAKESLLFYPIPFFDINSIGAIVKTLIKLPFIVATLLKVMYQSDHLHLRCPSNVGLLACVLQIFFPFKKKTAKYAGNWDFSAPQPWTYRLQKWILNNTYLTKNMQVLVYGSWPNASANIKPFFTATYREQDKKPIEKRNYQAPFSFVFAGTLSLGKQPNYAVQLVQKLLEKGIDTHLDLYGEGVMRGELEQMIVDYSLQNKVILHGNQAKSALESAFQKAHFVILPSRSEGWPKVIAEAMFWGCIPMATPVSCVPYMMEEGERGVLLQMNLEADVAAVAELLQAPERLNAMQKKGVQWSRTYTTDLFEQEIKKLLTNTDEHITVD